MGSKPYIASGKYLQRMSPAHCKGCRYDPAERDGERACPFNALYWDFFERQSDRLRGNHRLAMVYKNLDRMAPEARAALREQAAATLARLDSL